MGNPDKIPDGELFADLQMSLVDIALMKMLTSIFSIDSHKERFRREKVIAEVIKVEMKLRFSEEQIMKFLVNGYPRQVNLANTITKGGSYEKSDKY